MFTFSCTVEFFLRKNDNFGSCDQPCGGNLVVNNWGITPQASVLVPPVPYRGIRPLRFSHSPSLARLMPSLMWCQLDVLVSMYAQDWDLTYTNVLQAILHCFAQCCNWTVISQMTDCGYNCSVGQWGQSAIPVPIMLQHVFAAYHSPDLQWPEKGADFGNATAPKWIRPAAHVGCTCQTWAQSHWIRSKSPATVPSRCCRKSEPKLPIASAGYCKEWWESTYSWARCTECLWECMEVHWVHVTSRPFYGASLQTTPNWWS